jgi:hypothetical protein
VGNVLSPVSGTIVVIDAVVDADATSEEDGQTLGRSRPTRNSGPRFPRPHLQRLETERPRSRPRLATGSTPPPLREEIDFDEAITEVNTPRPATARPRSSSAS